MPKTVVQISSFEDVGALTVLSHVMRPASGRVKLAGHLVEPATRSGWERRFTRLVFACGCAEATAMSLGALLIFACFRLFTNGFGLVDIILIPLIFLIGTGLGKWVGILRARRILIDTKKQFFESCKGAGFHKEGVTDAD